MIINIIQIKKILLTFSKGSLRRITELTHSYTVCHLVLTHCFNPPPIILNFLISSFNAAPKLKINLLFSLKFLINLNFSYQLDDFF